MQIYLTDKVRGGGGGNPIYANFFPIPPLEFPKSALEKIGKNWKKLKNDQKESEKIGKNRHK